MVAVLASAMVTRTAADSDEHPIDRVGQEEFGGGATPSGSGFTGKSGKRQLLP